MTGSSSSRRGSNTQVALPFTGLKTPAHVAVDTVGNVYLTDSGSKRVLELPAGSNTQVELPFTGLTGPAGVAVDAGGNVYIADVTDSGRNGRVLKLPRGSQASVELPFSGLNSPGGVAVDAAGNVYVTDGDGNDIHRVLKLPAR